MALIMTLRREEFHKYMKEVRPDNFTRDGLDVLYDILSNTGYNIEFDPVAICCDYAENTVYDLLDSYEELEERVADYVTDLGISADDVEAEEVADILNDWTHAVPTRSGTIVYGQF